MRCGWARSDQDRVANLDLRRVLKKAHVGVRVKAGAVDFLAKPVRGKVDAWDRPIGKMLGER
jgi:hypothetical protein